MRSENEIKKRRRFVAVVSLAIILLATNLSGCTPSAGEPSSSLPSTTSQLGDSAGLSAAEVQTLASLELMDDYPLYSMHFYAPYSLSSSQQVSDLQASASVANECQSAWACSLFAAQGDQSSMLYGRNFDWDFSPAVLLFTHPQDGYDSVSMVDIAYLGFEGATASGLMDLSLVERRTLLQAPLLPFDGMNEQGLAIGMAAVPPGNMALDPEKETTGSLRVMRMILDQAATVDEAVSILQNLNIEIAGGPPLHYLIADRMGRSVLVEFYQGEMVIIPNDGPWHQATNFLRVAAGEVGAGICGRYDTIYLRLEQAAGQLSAQEAIDLLQDVSQPGTQWSIVYGISTGEVLVSMGRQYDDVHTFSLAGP